MIYRAILFSVLALLAFLPGSCSQGPPEVSGAPGKAKLVYPPAPPGDQVDDYHGMEVADPYRWLEDLDSARTRTWIGAQNKITFDYLEGIPEREKIRERLTQLWNYEKYSVPFRRGGRYFFSKNDGLQNQSVLYTLDSLNAKPRVLLNPNQLSADGTVALSTYEVSLDGHYLAYALSSSGSDWQTWKVREVESGNDLPDSLSWSKFTGASWTHDQKGFFYSRYDEPGEGSEYRDVNYHMKLYYHRLGTAQSEDTLVYHRPDQKEWGFEGDVSEDGRYLIITARMGTDPRRQIFYKDLQEPEAKVVALLKGFDAAYRFLGNDGKTFWFWTDRDAPRGRVIAVDLENPAPSNQKELIPQAAETLEDVDIVNDLFIASHLKDAHSLVKIHRLDGSLLREVTLPGLGTASGFRGRRTDKETFYSFASFTAPPTVYRYDLETGESSIFRSPKANFHPQDYETRQIFCTSKDGTRIPMFISHKKGLELNGKNPTLLYGYGGFNISLTPRFSAANLAWMELGGIYAQPNLRGGGEYGEEWHQAGAKLSKQNVFDDFIAAAEWLIENKYTSTEKLAIFGKSNGGLLVGACMTQRPELFRAAIPAVGVLDMLRFQKFTIGWAWVSDFGSSDSPEEFKALYAYSPYHNIREGTRYPATFITTADHDDRVVPLHSYKFTAALQAAQGGPAPILIRIETKAGHGAGTPTSKSIEEAADRMSFLVRELAMEAQISLPAAGESPPGGRLTVEAAEKKAQEASGVLMKELSGRLMKALSEGPEHAVQICASVAQRVSEETAKREGVDLRRTALRLRNLNNAPDPYERRILEEWSKPGAKPAPHKKVIPTSEGGRELRYLQPIILKPLCTSCHGTGEEISDSLRSLILKYYPRDQATGFRPGDLRGAVSVRVPLREEG